MVLKHPFFTLNDTVKERFIKESITKERFFLILIPQKNENRVLGIIKERFYKEIPRMNGFIFHLQTRKPPTPLSVGGLFYLFPFRNIILYFIFQIDFTNDVSYLFIIHTYQVYPYQCIIIFIKIKIIFFFVFAI